MFWRLFTETVLGLESKFVWFSIIDSSLRSLLSWSLFASSSFLRWCWCRSTTWSINESKHTRWYEGSSSTVHNYEVKLASVGPLLCVVLLCLIILESAAAGWTCQTKVNGVVGVRPCGVAGFFLLLLPFLQPSSAVSKRVYTIHDDVMSRQFFEGRDYQQRKCLTRSWCNRERTRVVEVC